MSILNQMGQVDMIVRDHLYDETGPGGPREASGITVAEMLADINAIRGSQTDAGAIRRSLRNIEQFQLATKRNVGGSRALAYKWVKGVKKPSDYQPRVPAKPLPRATSIGVASNVTNLDDKAKRAAVDDLIEGRMANITGEKRAEKAKQPAKPVLPKMDPVFRPNGEEYMPRELAGGADVLTMRRLRKAGLYTLIAGPPGGGKTALMEAAFASETGGLFSLTGDEETKVDDFVGQWYPTGKEGEFYWADGPLTLALKAGGVLFVDDATLINPKAIACLYPIMDGRGVLQIKSHLVEANGTMQPELVKAQPGFYVVAAHNPGVAGAILSDALASRFTTHIWLESDLQLANALGVNAKFTKLALNMRLRRNKGELGVFVPEMRDLLAARNMGREFGDLAAAENLLGKAPEDFQDDFAAEIRTVFGFDVTPKRLEVKGQL